MGLLPPKLTHEEQALLNKFALLKKKRKAPAVTKTNNEVKNLVKVQKRDTTENVPTKVADPKDAKEIAKKLIASGQIKLDKVKENRPFKKAQTSFANRKARVAESATSNPEQASKIDNIKKDSYKNFVSSSVTSPSAETKKTESEQSNDNAGGNRFRYDKRRQANLFIQGYGLTKQILTDNFPQFGAIVNLYMDQDKGHGYVTYANRESAEKAIEELHGSLVNGVTLRVMYARKRPYDDNRFTWRPRGPRINSQDNRTNDRPNFNRNRSNNLDTPAQDNTIDFVPPNREGKEKRQLVTYDEDELDF